MALCEAAAWYKKHDMTLWDAMVNLYDRYGYYREGLSTLTYKGADGAEKIGEIMEDLRRNPPERIGNFTVKAIRDYREGTRTDAETGCVEKLTLPKSNVIYYELENDEWCCARPSGTEPKIKFYMGVRGSGLEDAKRRLEQLTGSIHDRLK